MCDSDKRILAFHEKIGLDKEITREDLKNALEGAIQDRGLFLYFIWKTLKELHPELETEKILAKAVYDYGLYKSQNMGDVQTAADALLNQSSKNGIIVFDQTITKVTDDYAEKEIRNCPLLNAFRKVGCTEEEVYTLCHDILMQSDYSILAPFDNVEVSFPKTLAESDVCLMCVKRVKK